MVINIGDRDSHARDACTRKPMVLFFPVQTFAIRSTGKMKAELFCNNCLGLSEKLQFETNQVELNRNPWSFFPRIKSQRKKRDSWQVLGRNNTNHHFREFVESSLEKKFCPRFYHSRTPIKPYFSSPYHPTRPRVNSRPNIARLTHLDAISRTMLYE